MSSLAEYIEWYADLSFYEKPFNEVDNLVLSMLTYYRYDFKRSQGKPLALRRCVMNSVVSDRFLRAAVDSRRFGTMQVSGFSEVFDKKSNTQFAAMTFKLTENSYYIAFRGTDNSVVGWREDFMISYRSTPSQTLAVKYLDEHIEDGCEYIVGGHSKGGNLALYGCCHISDEKLSRVTHIFNNDGPGLCPEVSDVSLVDRVRARTTVILPRYCIFGKIFAHDIPDTRIVTSSYQGINQHDILSWGVRSGRLDTAPDFESDSLWINDAADRLLSDMEPDERERLVETIFDTFEEGGAETRDQMMQNGIDDAENLLKNMAENDSLRTAAKIPGRALFGDFFKRLRTGKLSKLINANQLVEGILLCVTGLLMLIFPTRSFDLIIIILLGGVVAFQLYYTLRKLYESRWNFTRERTRVYIFLVMATLFAIILVKKQAIFVVGSGIAGGWLLVVAYRCFLAVKNASAHDFLYYKNIVKAILYLAAGVFIMLASVEMLKWFALTFGAVMVIDGICTIVYSFIRANERYSEKYSNLKEKVTHKKQQ